jgi:hypothetical protein
MPLKPLHCISRSFSLPWQHILTSLAAVSVAAGPASHAHPAASKLPRNQTPHAYTARCVGVPAAAHDRLHRIRVVGNTLEAASCRTRRRRSAKHRLHEREAVPRLQAVPIAVSSWYLVVAYRGNLDTAPFLAVSSGRLRRSATPAERGRR